MNIRFITIQPPRIIGACCAIGLVLPGTACSGGLQTSDSTTNSVAQTESGMSDHPAQEVLREEQESSLREMDQINQNQAESNPPPQSNDSQQVSIEDIEAEPTLKEVQVSLSELINIYKRLHIELSPDRRSELILELFADHRFQLQMLGFELMNRDLSSTTNLHPNIGSAVVSLVKSTSPEIRAAASNLLLRLVPEGTPTVLTGALIQEDSPIAADPMLRSVARWPNTDISVSVIRWIEREDCPFAAACIALWGLDQANMLTSEQKDKALSVMRSVDILMHTESSMKFIAKNGSHQDLNMTVEIMNLAEGDLKQWAAQALVETPRAVELIIDAARKNEDLFQAASESLIRHRHTPEGLRRLVSLPFTDENLRKDSIVAMGHEIDNDRIAEAVQLAELNDELTSLLLSRLLGGQVDLTPRVIKGILIYAEIELTALRPNRSLEAMLSIDDATLDPNEKIKSDRLKGMSLILLGRFEEAFVLIEDPTKWISIFDYQLEVELSDKIASFMIDKFQEQLEPSDLEFVRTKLTNQPESER